MDISGVSIPAVPEVQQQEPPRDAQLQTAVRETAQSGSAQNNTQTDADGDRDGDSAGSSRDESSKIGRHVDAHA